MIDQYETDIEEAPESDEGELSRIRRLADEMLTRRAAVDAAEAALAKAKAALVEIEESELPSALLAVGMKSFTLANGSSIELKIEHYGSITQEKSFKVLRWLEEHGHGSLIKRTFTVAFGKGDKALADKLMGILKAEYQTAKISDKQGVHHSTLKAFIREQIAQASSAGADNWTEGSEEFDLFSIHVRRFVQLVGLAASAGTAAADVEAAEF